MPMRALLSFLMACSIHAVACAAPAIEAAQDKGVPLKVGMQRVIAPFVLPDQNSGMFVDVLRAAFATQKIAAEFSYLPNVRVEEQFQLALLDVSTASDPSQARLGYLSKTPVSYFGNMAITLHSRIPELHSLPELLNYRVVAFRNARKVLGPAYDAVFAGHPNYQETSNMPSGALLLNRADVIISQPDIFQYYLRQQLPPQQLAGAEFTYHDVLGPGRLYWLLFRTEAQRTAFEHGIAQLYLSGEIDRILERYQREYGLSRDFLLPLDCQFRPKQAPQKCQKLADLLKIP